MPIEGLSFLTNTKLYKLQRTTLAETELQAVKIILINTGL